MKGTLLQRKAIRTHATVVCASLVLVGLFAAPLATADNVYGHADPPASPGDHLRWDGENRPGQGVFAIDVSVPVVRVEDLPVPVYSAGEEITEECMGGSSDWQRRFQWGTGPSADDHPWGDDVVNCEIGTNYFRITKHQWWYTSDAVGQDNVGYVLATTAGGSQMWAYGWDCEMYAVNDPGCTLVDGTGYYFPEAWCLCALGIETGSGKVGASYVAEKDD